MFLFLIVDKLENNLSTINILVTITGGFSVILMMELLSLYPGHYFFNVQNSSKYQILACPELITQE